MALANPYRVTLRRTDGSDTTIDTFAYSVMDAAQQALVSALASCPNETFTIISVGPPPEARQQSDVNRMIDRLVGRDKQP
jgi:hypothetical protein